MCQIFSSSRLEDPTAVYYLKEIQRSLPDVWSEKVETYGKKPIKIDLEDYIVDNPESLTGEDASCLQAKVEEDLALYRQGLEAGTSYLEEPSVSLPIHLFEAGFDIWLGGNRGTKYQRGHETLDSTVDVDEYWSWGNIEMSMEDQVSEINYILNATEKDSISYIGYSMGTMLMYYSLAMAGQDDSLAKTFNKIDRFLAITPCAWSNVMAGLTEE